MLSWVGRRGMIKFAKDTPLGWGAGWRDGEKRQTTVIE